MMKTKVAIRNDSKNKLPVKKEKKIKNKVVIYLSNK